MERHFSDRVQFFLSYAISVVMLIGAFSAIYDQQWFNGVLALLAILLTYFPALVQRSLRIFLPIEFDLIFTVFLFITIYLGSVSNYYDYFWWWDLMLHGLSGVLLGLVGFLIVYVMSFEIRKPLYLKAPFIAVFSFVFSIALGMLWEMFEFVMDIGFGFYMQNGSLMDTMLDLIVNALGAFMIAVFGFFYLKKIKIPIFAALIHKFHHRNPNLFQRIKQRLRNRFKKKRNWA